MQELIKIKEHMQKSKDIMTLPSQKHIVKGSDIKKIYVFLVWPFIEGPAQKDAYSFPKPIVSDCWSLAHILLIKSRKTQKLGYKNNERMSTFLSFIFFPG